MSARINLAANSAAASRLQPNWICRSLLPPRWWRVGSTRLKRLRRFLNPSLERDWANLCEIENMEAAVNRIEAAIKNEEHILVFGDFDL